MKDIKILDNDANIADSNYAFVRAWVEQEQDEPVKYDCLIDLDELDEHLLVDDIISVLDGTRKDTLTAYIHDWDTELAEFITLLEIKLM